MRNYHQFYIDGAWVAPAIGGEIIPVINPATEEIAGSICMGGAEDVERAVAAAHKSFATYSKTSLKFRLDLLASVIAVYEQRMDEMAKAISEEMGAPMATLAKPVQGPIGLWHLQTTMKLARDYPFQQTMGSTVLEKEPVGVCALITPWNWPMNQIACKVAPALAVGCTMILKPSELAPFSSRIFAEILHEAGVPAGVFNMIFGDGERIGPLLSGHALVDMVSLTGSTRAGASVTKHAADTIKVVSLELGGKSANIILDDADFDAAVTHGVVQMMSNSGQSCNAPSRMFVPASRIEEVERIAVAACSKVVVGDPSSPTTTIGPIANQRQYCRVQTMIDKGITEGAKLLIGGCGRPADLARGYYAKPTVFSRANNQMAIAREEIFGPVLTIIPYQTEDDAIRMANDTDYGLSGYVYAGTVARAREVGKQLRTGMVHLNGAGLDLAAPFGGFKQSGNGREWGVAGIEEFLEVKAMMGVDPG